MPDSNQKNNSNPNSLTMQNNSTTTPPTQDGEKTTQQPNSNNPVNASPNPNTTLDNQPDTINVIPPHLPTKYGGKKVIATIFGILLILGSVVAGAYLSQHPAFRVGSAWDCQKYTFSVSREGVVSVSNGSSRKEDKQKASVFINGTKVAILDVPELSPGNGATIGNVSVPSEQGFSWKVIGSIDCDDQGFYPPLTTPTANPEPSQTPQVSITPTSYPTTPIPTNPQPTLTLTPEITAKCGEIIVYDLDWNQLSPADLSKLSRGDVIRLAVSGITSSGTIDKARFTINGEVRPEVVTKKPGTDEFYDEYVIPSDVTTFNVSVEIHHSELGWF